MFYSQE